MLSEYKSTSSEIDMTVLEVVSFVIGNTHINFTFADIDGSCKLPCLLEMYRNDGLAHLGKVDHFSKKKTTDVVNGLTDE